MLKFVFILIAIVLVIFGFFPLGKCIYKNIFKFPVYAVKDIYRYFRYKEYNNCPQGFIDFYVGDFGQGKTLSAVNRAISMYDQYNNKDVWIEKKQCFMKSKVNILTNVNIARPHILLTSLQQLVDWCQYQPKHPNEWCVVLIDEASAVLNSRSFSSNLNAITINSLVTCRHFNLSLMLCTQKLSLCDALLRAVGMNCYSCHKSWRLLKHNIYRVVDVENATDLNALKPRKTTYHFTNNQWYDCYDTMATVGDLVKQVKAGNLRSESEIKESLTPIPRKNNSIVLRKK